jgi:hypothetical protein
MPSRAEIRVRVEQVLRGIVIVVLAVIFWQSLHERIDSGSRAMSARGIGRATLSNWTSFPKAPGRIHLQLDSVPSKIERAWLGALAGAGSSLTWSGDIAALMIEAQPVASPTGGTKVLVAAPSGSSLVMSDEVGVIDTLRPRDAGASVTFNSVADRVTARAKGSVASTVTLDSVVLHRILVIGEAGWESKFVVAALEEEGWKVDALIRVAPAVDVTQGSGAMIDTSRYSAVVALDGAAAPYANRIIEFARTGGGLVVGPRAASLDAIAPLRAGAVGRATLDARAVQAAGSVTLATLALAPITSLRGDAVPVEKRAGAVAIATRRIGAGRALQLGYEDTWRWRMNGGDGAIRDHRIWWTRQVSSVAYGQRVPRVTAAASADEAPMIGVVAAIGSRASGSDVASLSGQQSRWMPWLFLVLALGVMGETVSRRLRGAS